MEVIKEKCNTQVNVEHKLSFGCIPERIYKRLDVQINQSVRVRADYFEFHFLPQERSINVSDSYKCLVCLFTYHSLWF